jgi:threonine/homoserine/homoserine lactone efflux protein
MDRMDLSVVLGFVVAVFLVSLVPGPDMLFIVANAAVGGRRAGVVAAAGSSSTCPAGSSRSPSSAAQ